MKRAARTTIWVVAVVASLLALIGGSFWWLLETERGMAFVRDRLTGLLAERVNGSVHIGEIASAGLLRGAVLRAVEISDENGRLFLRLDSVRARYRLANLARKDLIFDDLTIFNPVVQLEQLPGDSLWNYQHLFADTTRRDAETVQVGGQVIRVDHARIVDGTVVIRRPWSADGGGALGDPERAILEEVPGGTAQAWRFESITAETGPVVIQDPAEQGRRVELDTLAAYAFLLREPFVLSASSGTVRMVDATVELDLPRTTVGNSLLGVRGVLDRSEGLAFDLNIDGQSLATADFRWFEPRLPTDGRAVGLWNVRSTAGDGLIATAEDLSFTAPGTRISGAFGVETGTALRWSGVDLQLAPLDLAWLAELRPGIPVQGLISGRLTLDGPMTAIRTRGSVSLQNPARDRASPFGWNGTIAIGEGVTTQALLVDSDGFDLALLSDWQSALAGAGVVAGTVELNGGFDEEGLGLDGALRLLGPHAQGGDAGRVLAHGQVRRIADGRSSVDLTLETQSLPLRELHRVNPRFAELGGVAAGTLRLFGPTDALEFQADFAAAGGRLAFDGLYAGSAPVAHVTGSGSATSIELPRLHDRAPDGRASVRFTLDLRGTELAEMEGPVRLDLDSAVVRGARLESGALIATLDHGLARIDTVQAFGLGSTLAGKGTFGLVPETEGVLTLHASVPRLDDWERPLFGQIENPLAPRVRGALELDLSTVGSTSAIDVTGIARLSQPGFDQIEAASATISFEGTDVAADTAVVLVEAAARSVRPFGWDLDSARVVTVLRHGFSDFTVTGWNGQMTSLLTRGGVLRTAGQPPEVRIAEATAGSGSAAWLLIEPITFTVGSRGMQVDSVKLGRLDGRGTVVVDGQLSWDLEQADRPQSTRVAQDFTVDVGAIPVPDLLRLARLGETGPASAGALNGHLHVTGPATAPVIDGDIEVVDLRYGELSLDRVTSNLAYAGRHISGQAQAFNGGRRIALATGEMPYDLRFVAVQNRRGSEPMNFDISADSLPVVMGLGVLDAFRDIGGVVDGRVTLAGTPDEPVASGALTIRRGAATFDALGVRYESVAGTIVLQDERTAVVDVALSTVNPRDRSARGTAVVQGTLDLAELSDPGFDLDVIGQRMLAARRRDVDVTASGTLHLGGHYTRPVVTGDLEVANSTLYLDELYRRYQVVELEERFLFQAIDTSSVAVRTLLPASENPFLKNLQVDGVNVEVGSDSRLRGRQLDVEVTGNLNVAFDRREEDLVLTGVLTAVRGNYNFEQPGIFRVFQIRQGGTIEFVGTPGIDPSLNIEATYRARTQSEPLEIIATLGGTLQAPRLSLSSDRQPPISESDLYSYLLFGAPTYAFNLGTIGGLGTGQRQRGLGLGLEAVFNAYGFGYFTSGLQSVAQSTGLVDYVGLSAAETGAVGSQGIGGILAGTEIEVGRYLSPSLYAAFTQRLRSPTKTPGVRLEWRFHPTYSMELFTEDRFARAPLFGLAESIEPRTVYGFFLFRQWGY